MKQLDCRNMACPAPVISVRNALGGDAGLVVLLDNGAPRENVARFARNRGYTVIERRDGETWELTITPSGKSTGAPAEVSRPRSLLITSDRLGDGPEELGRLLMKNMIHTLLETEHLPTRMLFLNSGVRLTTEGSDVIEALNKLAGMGVEIYSCGLCLDFFGCKDRLKAGGTTNMLTTVETLLGDELVIKL